MEGCGEADSVRRQVDSLLAYREPGGGSGSVVGRAAAATQAAFSGMHNMQRRAESRAV